MLILLLFSFLAGIVTILSPCIFPLLPIILSTSDGKKTTKPIGVVIGFVTSFVFFTLFLSTIVRFFGVPPTSLRIFSIVILIIFGMSLLLPKVQVIIEVLFSKLSCFLPNNQQRSGFIGGYIVGISLGLLWTPCVGPILASVISLALTGTVTTQTFFITMSYAVGTAIPMFMIIFLGSKALQKVPYLVRNTGNIQKAFGVIMIITAIGMYFNFDRRFQSYIIKTFPNYGTGLISIDVNSQVQDNLQKLNTQPLNESLLGKPMLDTTTPKGPIAPELIPGGDWFNSEPVSLSKLKGKVVLIDFWTYTCINCQRTLPYLKSWWQKYSGEGLVIIGVHSPEFEFEKDTKNVQQAIHDFDLKYPIMQDNNFSTWRAYSNQYWPAKYLIDKDGYIRYTHFGEGGYDQTEQAIQKLLKETGKTEVQEISNPTYTLESKTPELYLGYNRIEFLSSKEKIRQNETTSFTAPVNLLDNTFAYIGDWNVQPEYASPNENAKLLLNFEASNVYLVARSKNGKPATIKIYLDDKVQDFGNDNIDGVVTINTDRLYNIIHTQSVSKHILRIEFQDSNIEVYAFTFG